MYIKRVELTHFKSFGGTTQVPLLPEFTVISGPNGSGKSNILDALLFALGLSSSKGMRAERLPDLVNQTQSSRGRSTIEASVTVTFALDDEPLPDPAEVAAARHGMPELRADEFEEAGEFEGNGHAQNGAAQNDQAQNSTEQNGAEQSSDRPASLTDWTVTRKLRVTQQGTYTSNYYINDLPCTLTDLHEQLHKFRIYPEGYNVVLQGDVTSIISMNSRERREIIDELAGVGAFDRKINQAKDKLNAVKEREEKFRIVEKELIVQRDRLAQDRIKAEKYQKLKTELQAKTLWEAVLVWRSQQQQAEQIQAQIASGERSHTELAEQITVMGQQIQAAIAELDQLNAKVKALGEDELLALQSTLATREAELRQIERQQQELVAASQTAASSIDRTQQEIREHLQQLDQLAQQAHQVETQDLAALKVARDQAKRDLDDQRQSASAIASASDAWVQEQTALRHQIEALLQTLEPQRTEQARLQERVEQLRQKIQEQTEATKAVSQEVNAKQTQYTQIIAALSESLQQVDDCQKAAAAAEQELQIQQDTQNRLTQEQRDKQRQIDKLEAQAQAMQETQGTGMIQVLDRAQLSGMHGLVAQLGRVDPRYQLALEIAAGARLSYLVVEDDRVAAAGIQILKQQRAGRATFLPLNKIRAPQFTPLPLWNRPDGFIDYAANLIECDDRFQEVFAYVFANTVVFDKLETARRQMGQYRIITLDGELLETSGAMTGGSINTRQGTLHFGTVEPGESAEAIALRDRLHEIDRILIRCQQAILDAATAVKARSQALMEARQHHREIQLQAEQIQNQIVTLSAQEGQLRTQLSQNTTEFSTAQTRLQALEQLPRQEAELQQQRQALADLEQSQSHSEWQQLQSLIQQRETVLSDRQLALQTAEQSLQNLQNQQQRLQEKIEQQQQRLQDYRNQQTTQLNQQTTLSGQQAVLAEQISQIQVSLAAIEQTLASEKQERDRAERQLREQQTQQQQLEWQRQKLVETQQTRRQELSALQEQLEIQRAELPDPLPELPEVVPDLTALQHELRSMQKRLQAMEPVNMLALEEYDRTQSRLEELSQKLTILDEERTELLLRIENFTTLRQRAFKEAFDAVNENFQTIFAELSDGDGYLHIDDPNDPFGSGLNLVAHPKGKPVRRLASMSGGEKSLTALSFIFALQRYRPSPFYAFDEVDMFLDGANVERLAKMIKHQAQQAQFIVVSLRRPMIEAAERTIGVTQARGAYTQVLGIDLQPQNAAG